MFELLLIYMHCKLSSILALSLAVFLRITVMFFFVLFLFYCFLGTCTLDRFPGGDRMKPLPFLGIFMFALRWQQAECVV